MVTDTTNEVMLANLNSEIHSCMRTAALKSYNSISTQAQQKRMENVNANWCAHACIMLRCVVVGAWMVQEQAEIDIEDGCSGRRESVVQVNVDMQGVDYIATLAQLGIELCQEIEDFHGSVNPSNNQKLLFN